MLLFIILIFLVGACYHAKSWKHLLRNIVIAETILIIGLLVTVAGTAKIDSDYQMHRDYAALFLGNALLDTMWVFGSALGSYAFKKIFARRDDAPPSPDDKTEAITKYWKTGASIFTVLWAISCLVTGLACLSITYTTWTEPQQWTAADREFFPWVFGFGIVLFLAGGTLIALKLSSWMKKVHSKNPKPIVPRISPTTKTEGKSYFLSHWQGKQSITRSFWINWLLASLIIFLSVSGFIDFYLKPRSENIPLNLKLIIGIVGVGVTFSFAIWQTVGVLRSAKRQIQSGGNRFWAWLAILIVVAGMFLGVSEFAQKHFKDRKPIEQITSYRYDVRRLEDAGFSGDEIQDWSIDQAIKLRKAGFSQDEVDDFQCMKPPVTNPSQHDYTRVPTDKDFHNAALITLNGCRPFYEKAVGMLKELFSDSDAPPLRNPKRLYNETPSAYLVRIEMRLPYETPEMYLDRMRQLKEMVLQEIREADAFPTFRDIMERGTKCP